MERLNAETMSTLCRAKQELRNVRGARPSRSLCGASRAAIPVKDVPGGTPGTARETHALPTHLSAFLNAPQGNPTQGIRGSHSFDNHSPDDFFRLRRIRPFFVRPASAATVALCGFAFDSRIQNQSPSQSVAASRSDYVKGPVKVIRPNAERVKVIHSETTVKTEKSVFCHFPIGSCCRPIGSKSVNRIEEKIKKCQKRRNPCNPGLTPTAA